MIIRDHLKADQTVFVGVVNPIDPQSDPARRVRPSPRGGGIHSGRAARHVRQGTDGGVVHGLTRVLMDDLEHVGQQMSQASV